MRLKGTLASLEWLESSFSDVKYNLTVTAGPTNDTALHALVKLFSKKSTDNEKQRGTKQGVLTFKQLLISLPLGVNVQLDPLEFYYQGERVALWLYASIPALATDEPSNLAGRLQKITLDAKFIAGESMLFNLMESRTRAVINRSDEFGEMTDLSDAEVAPLVAGSVESQLNVLLKEGYLDYKSGFYSANVTMSDGRFSINGKPLMLGHFMR